MALVRPPKDLSSAGLFRLVARAKPSLPISYRVAGLENISLSVRALSTSEWAEVEDDCSGTPDALRQSKARGSLVARALLADGLPAFDSVEQVFNLPEDEFERLSRAVLSALDRFGPPKWRRDEDAWRSSLVEGAFHLSNELDAKALGASYEGGGMSPVVYRPERYFGVGVRDLTPGNWLVFHVCQELNEKGYR